MSEPQNSSENPCADLSAAVITSEVCALSDLPVIGMMEKLW